MSPTRTAPGRAGRTCSRGSSRADPHRPGSTRAQPAARPRPPEEKSQKPPQMLAVGGTRSDRCSGPRRDGGGGEHGQWTTCPTARERARGRRRGHKRHGPKRPGGRGYILRWARRGSLVNGGMKKVRDPRNSTAAEKFKVLKIRLVLLESEGASSLTPSKIATKTSWTNWQNLKQFTAALVKEQRGVLVYDSREVCCCR